MRFLVDENVPLLVAAALEAGGHDCFVVARDQSQAADEDVMVLARRDGRVLITFDADFSRMIFHELRPPPAGVIYMRGRSDQARLVSEIFLTMFVGGQLDPLGRFIVIEPDGSIRTSPLG